MAQISRWRFFKAALVTHASAAYLVGLSVLGAIEQTRDVFIPEATQKEWHIDKIQLPPWFWVIAILCVVIWRIVDHSHKELNARDGKISQLEEQLVPAIEVGNVRRERTPTQAGAGHDALYVQISIKSKSRVQVNGCEGHLIKVERWNVGKHEWEVTTINEWLQLGWSNVQEGVKSVVLYPDVPRNLNIFWIPQAIRDFILCTFNNRMPLRAQGVFNLVDVFRFHVVVTGDSCSSVPVCLEVKGSDSWEIPFLQIVTNTAEPPVVCIPDPLSR